MERESLLSESIRDRQVLFNKVTFEQRPEWMG